MKIMGIDISSKSTGWAVIDGDKLISYGKINPTGSLTHGQKLYYFGVELERMLNVENPDVIFIEDVVQVKSVKVLKILARFNGVAVVEAYRKLQVEPVMFEPTEWKKMVLGFGSAKKVDAQVYVCKRYKLLSDERVRSYEERIESLRGVVVEDKSSELKDLKKRYKKSGDEGLLREIEKIKEIVLSDKKGNKKEIVKKFDEMSMGIYTESSVNEDIADAVCVALAGQMSIR